ncbi:MAG: 5-bromo-4-chloroindolyl phosphate hydrolysis family protein [Eubacteriales bacterium]|nr:5-bromo-4-chloroindolyl phosphate hydrolysis family protein [Eubacteriales bacterium]
MEERKKKYDNQDFDTFGDWLQDVVQDAMDAVESVDFGEIGRNIHQAVDQAKYEVGRQFWKNSGEEQREQWKHKLKKPIASRQPMRLRRLPGKWSGPIGTIFGGIGLTVFGALSLGIALAGLGGFGAGGAEVFIPESICLILTQLSGILFFAGRSVGKRAKRIQKYVKIWGENSFMMLEELSVKTGYSLKKIRKDVRFMIEQRLWPHARLDEEQTCLMLTEEAGQQYDAAMETKERREQEERIRQEQEQERVRQQEEREQLSAEERRLLELQESAGVCLQEIKEARDRIHTKTVLEKIDRLELLLSRIFVSIQKHPENISRTDRLAEYYLPAILKLIQVYAETEQQPVQGENIIRTRKEIEDSLDTVNQALEEMFDDMFQEIAMDVSSDIRVLEAMLAKDGWGARKLRSQGEEGRDFWQ